MRTVAGFIVPATTAVAGSSFGHQLIVAGVSGLMGVIGVTLAAYITTRNAEQRRTGLLLRRLRPRPPADELPEDEQL